MRQYWFAIVRRGYDRYSWLFVEVKDGRRRVLAQSIRDYRSVKKARKAAAALRCGVMDADIIDASGSQGARLMAVTSSFEPVPGVLPLVVGESVVEEYPAEPPVRQAAVRRKATAGQPGGAAAGQPGEAAAGQPGGAAAGKPGEAAAGQPGEAAASQPGGAPGGRPGEAARGKPANPQ